MFIQANANPSTAFSNIDFFAVWFVTEYSIDPIFCIAVDRFGYLMLITCSRSSDSGCCIKCEITIFASRLVTFSPSSVSSRVSSVDIVHPGSAQVMSEVWSLSEGRHWRSRESVLEFRILENHVRKEQELILLKGGIKCPPSADKGLIATYFLDAIASLDSVLSVSE